MKSKTLYLFLLSFLLFSIFSYSQTNDTAHRICLTHRMSEINKSRFKPSNVNYREVSTIDVEDYIVIPVVVHVIHNDGNENLSDQIIKSQIDVLNEDFGHYGNFVNDPRGEDSKIRFCLAKRDPDGNPTNGIIRIKSTATDLLMDNEMLTKDLSRWNPEKYLNIWIVKSIDGDVTTQGYSYMPSLSGGPSFDGDGIVMVYKYFGRFSGFHPDYELGRSCTHELGHYFDLMHTWGGDDFDHGEGNCFDDDGIKDTPNCSTVYYSGTPFCYHPYQCGNTRMIENFMDYSFDSCMKLFTPGQNQKIKNSIITYRTTLVSYNNLIETGCIEMYDSINSNNTVDIYPNPASDRLIFRTHLIKDTSDLDITMYDLYGRIVFIKTYSNLSKSTIEQALFNIQPGIYIIKGVFGGAGFTQKIMIVSSF